MELRSYAVCLVAEWAAILVKELRSYGVKELWS